MPTFSSPKEKALAKVGGPQVKPFLLAEFQDFLFAYGRAKKAGPDVDNPVSLFPRPPPMPPHWPGADKNKNGKEAPRGCLLGTPNYLPVSF